MKKYLTLIAAATLMAACSNEADQTEQQAEGQPIAVAVAEGGLTRATGEVSIPRQIADNGFGLFGCYTGQLTYENTSVSSDFMYNQKVNSPDKGETWEYYPLKYWPNSTNPGSDEYNEYISFFAYAPYEASPRDDGRCIFGMSNKYEKGDPWVNYRLAEDPWDDANPQVDLMYGVRYKSAGPNGSDLLFTDQKKPVINETMKFYFQHALACIGDKITIRLSDELYNLVKGEEYTDYASIIATGLTIDYTNLTTKARLNLNSPSGPNWKEIISGEITCDRQLKIKDLLKTLTNEPLTLSEGQGLFYIPMQVKGTDAPYANITLSYAILNNAGSVYEGTTSTRIDLDLNLEGQKEGIALILGKDLDLLHLTYPVTGEDATEPSYSRQWK